MDEKEKEATTNLIRKYTNKFGSSGEAVSEYSYRYDTLGNIQNITSLTGKERTYIYNDYNEILKAREAYENGNTKTYTYTYDNGGNILTETINGQVHTYTYDDVWKDKLISYDGKEITYNDLGCPLTYMDATLTWDTKCNLTGVETPTDTITYTYFSDGTRRTKEVNGSVTTYHYNNGMLLSETTGDETLRYYYDSTGKVTALTYKKGEAEEESYFYARNMQGDITAIYRSSDSKLIGTYEYDLWGKLISVTEAEEGIDTADILHKNPFRYRNYYYDNETGYYCLSARYYNPELRRFLNADSLTVLMIATTDVGCKNLFVYAENNPVVFKDSTGNFLDTIFDVAFLVGSIVDVCKHPTDPWAWAGLAGDVIDLIPGITGVGEGTKALGASLKSGKYAKKMMDDGMDVAEDVTESVIKAAKKSSKKREEKPQNFSPEGAGRNGAYREAKRKNNIPMSEQPKVKPNVDRRGKRQPGKIYEFENGVEIRDDAKGHEFPDDPTQNRGPHFNDPSGNHFDY